MGRKTAMLKKILLATVILMVIGVLVFGAVNRTLAQKSRESLGNGANRGGEGYFALAQQPGSMNGPGQGRGQGNGGNGRRSGLGTNADGSAGQYNLPLATTGELSPDESAALLYMREEEKLAHDVYVTLFAQWKLPTFQHISRSEQTHTDAVKALIDRYGLTDPASSKVGVFTNPDLQALYNDLVARGSQSLAEALKVGAAIEEIDILDLQKYLAQTDNADIQQVFNNLLNGSYNHLRAYVSNLSAQTGETYQPQYLSAETYQSIIGSGSTTSGNGRGGGGGGGEGSAGGGGGVGGYRGGRQ
jgi:hypothetical protein